MKKINQLDFFFMNFECINYYLKTKLIANMNNVPNKTTIFKNHKICIFFFQDV